MALNFTVEGLDLAIFRITRINWLTQFASLISGKIKHIIMSCVLPEVRVKLIELLLVMPRKLAVHGIDQQDCDKCRYDQVDQPGIRDPLSGFWPIFVEPTTV